MPTSCDDCPFLEQTDYYASPYCRVSDDDDMMSINEIRAKRRDNCPLIPVPPHGRLIDADDLRQSLKDSIDECHNWADEIEGGEMYARVSQSLGTFVECSLRVKAAPTIIPADKESGE